MRTCFKCAGPDGVPRNSHAMVSRWYDDDAPQMGRTIFLCDTCFQVDARAVTRSQVDFGDDERAAAGWIPIKRGAPELGWYRPDLDLAA